MMEGRGHRRRAPGGHERRPGGTGRRSSECRGSAGGGDEPARAFEAMLGASPDYVYVYDRKGRHIYASSRGAAALGLAPAEMVGKTWRELGLPPEPMRRFERQRENVLRTGQPVTAEMSLPTKHGKRTYEYTLTPMGGTPGNPEAVVAVIWDVTERRRAEVEQLLALDQQLLLKRIVLNAPIQILVLHGPEHRIVLANPATVEVAQSVGKGELVGRTFAAAYAELADEAVPLLDRVYRDGESLRATDRLMPAVEGGRAVEYYITFDLSPLRDEEGRVEGVLVLAYDTTEEVLARQKAEELARVAQQRTAELQGVLDSMVDGVLVYDAEGHVTLANAFTRRLLGLAGPAEGQAIVATVPERARLRHLDGRPIAPDETASARALAGETVSAQAQIAYNWQTGRDVYISVSAAPIWGDDGKVGGAVVVVRDVTELVELDRLKDEFLAVVAHELKTPIAIMKGYAQALPNTMQDVAPRTRKMLEAIDRGADRIGAIVNALLDVSRLMAGGPELALERIDLSELVTRVADRIALGATKHSLRVLRAQQAVVEGDRDRLEQVLANLLDNAMRYSPAGGDVDVEVAVRNGEAVVSVRDYGVGIPAAKQSRIFQRFYRAHTRTPYDYGGMGVGLYIAHEIVKSHGGRMWFESEEGKGSTFYFSLPLAQ